MISMEKQQFEKMLEVAASKLGLTPEQLKKAAETGNTEAILSRLDGNSADKIRSAMSNPKTAEAVMNAFKNKTNGK